MKTYLFSYTYAGRTFGLDVPADSLDEAWGRVARMSTATYDGELIARVAVPGGDYLRRLIGWWRRVTDREGVA